MAEPINGQTNGDTNGIHNPNAVIPSWVTAEIFEDVLKETVTGYKQILNFKPRAALAAGENYATIMLRIEIEVELQDGTTKTVSYMLKVAHESEMFLEFMKKHNMFDVEVAMYNTIVPELEQMYRDAGVEIRFGAKCFKLKDTKANYVLLEDLRPYGFKNADRLEGLDLEHTKCALRILSQWHAATATRVAVKGHYPELIKTGFWRESERDIMDQMQKSLGGVIMQAMKTYDGHEIYYKACEKLQDHLTDELFKSCKPDPNEFNVLVHGDCWTNNIMYKYDAFGKIKETYLVDYQIPRYGTPAQDLLYFLMSSPKLEIKLKQFDYLIKYYYEHLAENLKLLKYPKKLPTLREIHIQLYKHGIWGYSAVTGVMAAVLLDPNKDASLDNFLEDSEKGLAFKRLMYTNARYKKHAEALLPWLYYRGCFEC